MSCQKESQPLGRSAIQKCSVHRWTRLLPVAVKSKCSASFLFLSFLYFSETLCFLSTDLLPFVFSCCLLPCISVIHLVEFAVSLGSLVCMCVRFSVTSCHWVGHCPTQYILVLCISTQSSSHQLFLVPERQLLPKRDFPNLAFCQKH